MSSQSRDRRKSRMNCDFAHTGIVGPILFCSPVKRSNHMIQNLWNQKGFALVAAIATVACVAALLSMVLTFPEPVSSAALGPDWQCSRIAFVFTTCTRLQHAESVAVRLPKEQVCRKSRT
jgi:hypothetical protein